MPFDRNEVQNYIRQRATSLGIDPYYALRVFKQESGFNPEAQNITPKEESYGVTQLNAMGGLGVDALNQGINIRDPNTWKQQVDFSLNYAKQDGWRKWYGARDTGVGRWDGIRTGGSAPQKGDLTPVRVAQNNQSPFMDDSSGSPPVADKSKPQPKKTGTDPFDPWLAMPSIGLAIGPFTGGDPQANQAAAARRAEIFSGAAEVPPLAPSPDYSTVRNALLSLGPRMTSADAPWWQNPNAFTRMTSDALGGASEYLANGISDFFMKPEKDLKTPDAASPSMNGTGKEQAALLAALTTPQGGTTGASGPGAPSVSQAFGLGIPVPNPPAPPTADPYVIPAPPTLQAPGNAPQITGPNYDALLTERERYAPQAMDPFVQPNAPQLVAPDMTAARKRFDAAAPTPFDDNSYRQSNNWNTLAMALSRAAGGSEGDIFSNLAEGFAKGNQRYWDSNMERQLREKEMLRQYNLQGANFESDIAGKQASVQNQNAQNQFEVDSRNAQNRYETNARNLEAQRQFGLSGLDFQRNVAETKADINNKNANIQFQNSEGLRKFNNDVAATDYERTQQNAATAYKTAQDNAKLLYQDSVARYELTAPKVISQSKDGVVIQRVRNNAQGEPEYVYDVKNWGSGNSLSKSTTDQLDDLKKTFGEDSPTYRLAMNSALLNTKDVNGLKFEIAKEASKGGYLDKVLPDLNFGEQADEILASQNVIPGADKNYADKRDGIIGQLASMKLDLTNPEVIKALAQFGNTGAGILLGAAGSK